MEQFNPQRDMIAGKRIPKWDVPIDDLMAITNNIENKSQLEEKLAPIEEARAYRKKLGICDKCRLQDCLCREGQ